jgi:predicted CxxxxCH...CXXCH cytochrome family protein
MSSSSAARAMVSGRAGRLVIIAGAWTLLSCTKERPVEEGPPVFDNDIEVLLARRCAPCHEGETPPGGWRATSFLDVIACVASNGAPATLPPDERAPILRVLDTDRHRGLIDPTAYSVLDSWVRGGAPAFRPTVHPPGIVDPRSDQWHGKLLRDRRWAPMLDGNDVDACGRCHDGSPARPDGVFHAAPDATACTSCHSEPTGALACSTCHGQGDHAYPPRDPCFFPGDGATAGAHAAHANPTASSEGFACVTCHPMPSADVMSGIHGNGAVEIVFDAMGIGAGGSYDRTTGVCAVACHDRGGARARPKWSDPGPMTCGGCHGAPPAGHYQGSCTTCHAEANSAGDALTGHVLHLNGRVDLGDGSGQCGSCHGQGDDAWPSTPAHGAHRKPTTTTSIACESCHIVPRSVIEPPHLDGKVTIAFAGRALDRGAIPAWDGKSCTSVACHGDGLRDPPPVLPVWTDTTGAARACDACHRVPPSQHTTSTSCDRGECHGSEVVREGSNLSISESGKLLHINGVVDVGPP